MASRLSRLTLKQYETSDILSEMNIAALEVAPMVVRQGMKNPRGYLAITARNGAIDWIRSRRCQDSSMGKFAHISIQSLVQAKLDIDLDGRLCSATVSRRDYRTRL